MFMSKENAGVVPKYRFPEFKGAVEWEVILFDKAFNLLQTNTFSRIEMTREQKEVQNIHYGDILTKYGNNVGDTSIIPYINADIDLKRFRDESYLQDGDIIIADTAEDLTAGKALEIRNVNSKILAGLHTMLCRPNKEFAPNFLGHYMNSPCYHGKIKPLLTGTKVYSISKSNIKKTGIHMPNIEEQQKIADCLTSLDELIAAENKKLETLKAHKKGLMQKLLPTEGKTMPEWRFPEFRDNDNWETNPFKTYIKLYRGSSPRPIKNFLTRSGGVNWIKIGDTKNANGFVISNVEEQITYEGAKRSRHVHIGELILANSMSYGKTYETGIDGCIYDGWFVLREYEEHFDKNFLIQQLNSDNLQSQYSSLSAGGIVLNISSDIVYSTLLSKPKLNEQRKIADFLSAVDNKIAAQSEKIQALNIHKKGLMQGLFPSAQEVTK